MDKKIKLDDSISQDIMSIGQLWEELATFAKNRVEDNKLYDGLYPFGTRDTQLTTLNTIVNCINKFHQKYKSK